MPRVDFSTCTECGRCQSQCPTWNHRNRTTPAGRSPPRNARGTPPPFLPGICG
ncbi:4Fe-4S dicluster domain-containing protein [Streptomyces sp. NPDC001274]